MATQRGARAPAPRITPAQTAELLNRGQAIAVDVRSPEYYADGHIPGAISAPLNYLGRMLSILPRDRTIVFY